MKQRLFALALTGLLLGLFAVLVTPREEEPQISVTFANVFTLSSRRQICTCSPPVYIQATGT